MITARMIPVKHPAADKRRYFVKYSFPMSRLEIPTAFSIHQIIERVALTAQSVVLHIVLKRIAADRKLAVLQIQKFAYLHLFYIFSLMCKSRKLFLIQLACVHLQKLRRLSFSHKSVDGIRQTCKKKYGKTQQHCRNCHKYKGGCRYQFVCFKIIYYHPLVHQYHLSRSLTSLN